MCAMLQMLYKWSKDGHVHMLIVNIIHHPVGDVTLNHNLWLNVGCSYTILIG